jgi:hypothetical protein
MISMDFAAAAESESDRPVLSGLLTRV